MTKFVAVWSLKRGVIDPPEVLDDAEQWRVTQYAVIADATDRDVLRQRATRRYQEERDPLPSFDEVLRMRARVESEDDKRAARMLAVMGKARVA